MRPWARPHDRTQPQPPSLADQFDLTLTLTASPPRCCGWTLVLPGPAIRCRLSCCATRGRPLRPQASRRVVDVRACSAGCLLLGRLLVSSFCRGDAHTAWFGRARAVGCPVPSRVPSSARGRAGQGKPPVRLAPVPMRVNTCRSHAAAVSVWTCARPIPLAFGSRQPGPPQQMFQKKMFLPAKRVLCLLH